MNILKRVLLAALIGVAQPETSPPVCNGLNTCGSITC